MHYWRKTIFIHLSSCKNLSVNWPSSCQRLPCGPFGQKAWAVSSWKGWGRGWQEIQMSARTTSCLPACLCSEHVWGLSLQGGAVAAVLPAHTPHPPLSPVSPPTAASLPLRSLLNPGCLWKCLRRHFQPAGLFLDSQISAHIHNTRRSRGIKSEKGQKHIHSYIIDYL